ncbi:MAG: Crp/Fnr family transcriptional regulator [Rhizomicrobium sp.]
MPAPLPNRFHNRLLSALPARDLDTLRRQLVPVALPRRRQIELPNRPIEDVVFLESGITSIVSNPPHSPDVEVGIIGFEGMTGLAVVLGTDQSPYSAYMQVPGGGHSVAVGAVRELMDRSAECRQIFLNFAQTFLLQASQTAVANARATIGERLARWLLMAQDRVQGDEIPLTHEFLSLMIGIRRAGVTEAMSAFAREGLIKGSRGVTAIASRAGLMERAGRFYGLPEREYRRLFPAAEAVHEFGG